MAFNAFTVNCRNSGAFDCGNNDEYFGSAVGGCLSSNVVCDGKQDCRNNNDENSCGYG